MRYVSTRSGESVSLDEALAMGIAADGGLFLPERLPRFSADDFADADSAQGFAAILLRPFFAASKLEANLEQIIAETIHFPIPVRQLDGTSGSLQLLELFHGPTAAFKDVGAAFLAACLGRLQGDSARPLTILVATSGDTGGAVAAAFNEKPGMRVVVLYPHGRVSARQEQQLTCWGDNVLSLAVNGSFDDCQALVKGVLADRQLAKLFRFSSANSINIGRLLPQTIYYADASTRHFRATGVKPGFFVPTGNLGNALACVIAREMGLPVGDIVLATNANRTIPDYLAGGEWLPAKSVATLASAMDVGNPSNMERLRTIYGGSGELARRLRAVSVSDDEIRQEIRLDHAEFGIAVCPHTATAIAAWRQLDDSARRSGNWIAVATAHPAKFEQIVEPIIGTDVALPPELERILSLPSRSVQIEPHAEALSDALQSYFSN